MSCVSGLGLVDLALRWQRNARHFGELLARKHLGDDLALDLVGFGNEGNVLERPARTRMAATARR